MRNHNFQLNHSRTTVALKQRQRYWNQHDQMPSRRHYSTQTDLCVQVVSFNSVVTPERNISQPAWAIMAPLSMQNLMEATMYSVLKNAHKNMHCLKEQRTRVVAKLHQTSLLAQLQRKNKWVHTLSCKSQELPHKYTRTHTYTHTHTQCESHEPMHVHAHTYVKLVNHMNSCAYTQMWNMWITWTHACTHTYVKLVNHMNLCAHTHTHGYVSKVNSHTQSHRKEKKRTSSPHVPHKKKERKKLILNRNTWQEQYSNTEHPMPTSTDLSSVANSVAPRSSAITPIISCSRLLPAKYTATRYKWTSSQWDTSIVEP